MDTEENWLSSNPTLSVAEIVFSKTDSGTFMKLGNGRPYSDTPFYQDIKIDGVQISSLYISHIAASDYEDLVVSNMLDNDTIYVVSSEYVDMYGE